MPSSPPIRALSFCFVSLGLFESEQILFPPAQMTGWNTAPNLPSRNLLLHERERTHDRALFQRTPREYDRAATDHCVTPNQDRSISYLPVRIGYGRPGKG